MALIKSSFNSKRRFKFKSIYFYFIIICAFLSLIILIGEYKVRPVLFSLGEHEVKKQVQLAMIDGIKEVRESVGSKINNILVIEKKQNGNISSVKLDSNIENELYQKLSTKIQSRISLLQDKNINIKIGELLQSGLFADSGPDIKLKIKSKGSVTINFVPKIESKAINMASVILYAQIHHEMGMLVPFSSRDVVVKFDYPIAQTLVLGEVPSFYMNGQTNGVVPLPSTKP